MMLMELADHNDDIRRLLEKGYALRFDSNYLVVRDIPYLDEGLDLKIGAFVTKLVFTDRVHVRQEDHQVFFAGGRPYGLDGKPIPNLGGGETKLALDKDDVIVERSFSNKPMVSGAFVDFFDKIESYVRVIAGPAIERHIITPLTFRVDDDLIPSSVFKFRDTLTSRAEIGDLSPLLKDEVVAVIGLGGTGSYLLDFLTKTPAKEIRAFDGDAYHVHNAFRSPGHLEENELGKAKAEVYAGRYDSFRHGLAIRCMYIDATSAPELDGVTFAFVCVDKGSARAGIFDLLIAMRIPFIDVGMGLNRKHGPLAGTIRTTYYPPDAAARVRDMGLAELVDDPDDEYRKNVQLSELNALNACIAVIRYKQLRGFYQDDASILNVLVAVEKLKTFSETAL